MVKIKLDKGLYLSTTMTAENHQIDVDGDYVTHSLLTPDLIEAREYQLDLLRNSRDKNTLVTLPTGLGKTSISLLLTAERMSEHRGKVLFLAPTKPLVQQHAEFYREALDIFDSQINVFTGDVRPDDREELWVDSTVVIATPQVIENDLVANRISLEDVVHITFDECHRATGDYAYNYIAERYHQQATIPCVTAMSASPGGDRDSILEVCENLGINNIEVRTEDDSDVKKYQFTTDVSWKEISLPTEILEIRDELKQVVKDRMKKLKDMGVSNTASKDVSQKQLAGMRGDASRLIDKNDSKGFKAMSIITEVDKLNPGIKTLESQGVKAFVSYMERNIESDANSSSGSKASKRLMEDTRVINAIRDAKAYEIEHPKLLETQSLIIKTVANNDDARIIVFTESRDTAEELTDFLSRYVDAHRFVGQSDKKGSPGMTQTEQKDVLDRFGNGEFDVLVSTSVAEEGLDVPSVDLVVFYEPVPESVRSIQRKGRTGRQKEGKVVVLVAADNREGKGASTIDETYYWISQRRENTMKKEIEELKNIEKDIDDLLDDEKDDAPEQTGLDDYVTTDNTVTTESGEVDDKDEPNNNDDIDAVSSEELEAPSKTDGTLEVVSDQREMDSSIPRKLSKMEDVETRIETLETGDYILSNRVAVERKEVDDFLHSLVDKERDIFQQIKEVSTAYDRPVLILEGDGLYTRRNIHPNAIRSTLASIVADFGVSVLQSEDSDDTAELVKSLAKREQVDSNRTVSIHGSKETKTTSEQQVYIVSSLADVGPVTAERLLDHFGTVRQVMNAGSDELQQVNGIGETIATQITEVVTKTYAND